MLKTLRFLFFCAALFTSITPNLIAQQATPLQAEAPAVNSTVVLPAGTRLSLILQTGITTRTAKPGDPVYFQTIFPIAKDNRIAIPMGTFVRGEIVSVKRAGRLKGRAELQLRIISLTFHNGYVVPLVALPGSLGDQGKESIDSGGRIEGSSGAPKDVATVGTATLAGVALGTYGGLVGGVANGSAHAFGAGVAAGGGAGLLAGLIIVALNRGPDAELRAGTTLDVIFDHPLMLEVAHLPPNDPGILPVPPPSARPVEKSVPRRSHLPIWGLPL